MLSCPPGSVQEIKWGLSVTPPPIQLQVIRSLTRTQSPPSKTRRPLQRKNDLTAWQWKPPHIILFLPTRHHKPSGSVWPQTPPFITNPSSHLSLSSSAADAWPAVHQQQLRQKDKRCSSPDAATAHQSDILLAYITQNAKQKCHDELGFLSFPFSHK